MWPKFYAYVMGFLVLAIFWALHHSVFRYIRRSDEILLWLNILFLMFVALVPFSTAVLGQHTASRTAVALYGGNMLAVSLSLSGIWWYATWRHRLVHRDSAQDWCATGGWRFWGRVRGSPWASVWRSPGPRWPWGCSA